MRAPLHSLPTTPAPPPRRLAADRGRLLVVDDEPLLLRALTRSLSRVGHAVEQASSAEEALERIARQRFDGAFVDVQLPGRGGLDLLAAVRGVDDALPVVLMTGSPTLQTAIDAVAAGALRYLVKPIDTTALEQAAGDAVRLRRRHDACARARALEPADLSTLSPRFDAALAGLFMVYQPIVRWSTRTVHAWEALVRTREPSVPHPGVLLDLAQRTGKLPELGRRIRNEVATGGDRQARLFVNLHPVDLLDDELFDPAAPLSRIAARVVLEVTERAGLEDVADLGDRLRRLRALGYRIAIDDLGEGYSGLTSLARIEPHVVKLDMSLVRGVNASAAQRHIIRSTVQLCTALGCEVVAEGVESPAERDALISLGCDLLQGYLFARPQPHFTPPTL